MCCKWLANIFFGRVIEFGLLRRCNNHNMLLCIFVCNGCEHPVIRCIETIFMEIIFDCGIAVNLPRLGIHTQFLSISVFVIPISRRLKNQKIIVFQGIIDQI